MFLLPWIRLTKLDSAMNSSVARITDLTPAELCFGYTLNRAVGEVAEQSRRFGTFLLHCLASALYYLFLLLFTRFVLSYILLCFPNSCPYVFRGVSIPFPRLFHLFLLFSFHSLTPILQLIVSVPCTFYFILDYLFLSVYYLSFFLLFLLVWL